MSLVRYLKRNRIDDMENDQEFMEAEYHAVWEYCEACGYLLTDADLETIKSLGLEESFTSWKETYVENLWQEFGAVPMNPETEETEEPWKHFPPGTCREEIWHWFEEKFNISVGKDLMGV